MQLTKYGPSINLILFFAFILFTIFQGAAVADEQEFITVIVEQLPKGLSLDPVKVKRGTTIIWINYDPGPITIKFTSKLGIACKTPTNFYGDLLGYYETGKISQSGTASICFIYTGQYDYEVRRLKGAKEPIEEILEGKVIVE